MSMSKILDPLGLFKTGQSSARRQQQEEARRQQEARVQEQLAQERQITMQQEQMRQQEKQRQEQRILQENMNADLSGAAQTPDVVIGGSAEAAQFSESDARRKKRNAAGGLSTTLGIN
ncbi:hypothetical protein Axy21_032 [Achromobacter phage vB_AxyP_19-32_Axy21]|uniref:Uncharacterized protein n=1 Tax=Achromobacter phage vB_AxyP_19-32_Axy21 TaxID=2591045 RepID=A0A514CVS8_9CAUD|nr:hypothetical protein Axy21_032 [Achromobacter phage vB_AxyP_19-32_Axy21]